MAYRGIHLSYETTRRWCDTFGAAYAAKLKRRRPKLGDKWFLDEVFLKINRVQYYLWRAVDQQGAVIDILVQPKRDRFAAMRFFRKLLQSSRCRPRVIITDKLRSYGAAKKVVLPRVAHRQSRYLNNRAENSHQPTRQRERRAGTLGFERSQDLFEHVIDRSELSGSELRLNDALVFGGEGDGHGWVSCLLPSSH